MDYTNRIKELRVKKGLYQRDIADILGTTQKQYSRYENGTEMPYALLVKLSNFFEVNTDYILGKTNIKEPYPKIREKSR